LGTGSGEQTDGNIGVGGVKQGCARKETRKKTLKLRVTERRKQVDSHQRRKHQQGEKQGWGEKWGSKKKVRKKKRLLTDGKQTGGQNETPSRVSLKKKRLALQIIPNGP